MTAQIETHPKVQELLDLLGPQDVDRVKAKLRKAECGRVDRYYHSW